MAGMSDAGFSRKTFDEILEGLRNRAKPIFQDLVPPGEEVDTSDGSTIGRLIGLITPDLDELWQASLEVYQAFDPNSATGVALENIVQYGGLSRNQDTFTTFDGKIWGDLNTLIPANQVVQGKTSDFFYSIGDTTLSEGSAVGKGFTLSSITSGNSYSISLITTETVTSVSVTATGVDTPLTVLQKLQEQVELTGLALVTLQGNILYIEPVTFYATLFCSAPSLTLVKVMKRLTFVAATSGPVPAPTGEVVNIITPVLGWDSVVNPVPPTLGLTFETDEALRERFRVSKALRAKNQAESLYSDLLNISGVEFIKIYENTTDTTDLMGLPEHSFMVVVQGGNTNDIAQAVWNNKPMGISSVGAVEVSVLDSQGIEHIVKFTRPTAVPIYVNLEVKKIGNGFPTTGVEEIRNAIIEYFKTNNAVGEPVVYSRLFTPANSVPGHQIDSLEIGTTPASLSQATIVLDYDEYPVISPENIVITVT